MRGFVTMALGIVLASSAGMAADKDFNGKWDLIIHKTPADHAWWIEISGAGTDMIRGTFSGFPDGLNPIQDAKIQDGVLHFSYDRPASQGKRGPVAAVHINYQFRYADGKLAGSMSGDTRGNWTFTGERAPAINEHDDGTWVKGKPVVLFDGKDLAGWSGITSGTKDGGHGWSVADGILTTKGRAGQNGENIATSQKFWNFELHAEYRVIDPSSNSGIGLRGRYEVQIGADFGRAEPGVHGTGALYHRIPPSVNANRPLGEWNTYEIRLVGREVTTVLNGILLYEQAHIDGMTGSLPFDPHEGQPGPIELQGDHGEVQYRNIVLAPLTQKGK